MADIFISYANEDRENAKSLAKALEDQDLSVWWDRRITVGQFFEEVIEEAVDEAKCVIAIWSTNSVNSKWVRAEAAEGFRRKILAPVAIEEVKPPLLYRQLQTASLVGWDGSTSHSGFRQLIQDLNSILGRTEPKKDRELIKPAKQELSEPAETYKNSIGMKFVLIPTGSFMMGSNISAKETSDKYGGREGDYEHAHPQHEVTISNAYYLQSTAVTQGQWKSVMKYNPSNFNGCGDDCPVENVSWNGAQEFIEKLNEMERTDNYRLPTEAEWEYACCAGTTTDFSFGDDAYKLADYAWYSDNSEGRTHPVRKKYPNSRGLYDMHGNVWEWVEDDWHKNYEGAPKGAQTWIDKPRNEYRVVCGGSWYDEAKFCRSANRNCKKAAKRLGEIGFRLAMSVALSP